MGRWLAARVAARLTTRVAARVATRVTTRVAARETARVAAKAVNFEKKGVAKARRSVTELRKFLRDS